MQERPEILNVCGKEIPLWCDLFVINEIQETFGSINKFERMLAGIERNDSGQDVRKEPHVEAVLFALPLMAREGYKKLALLGEPRSPEDVESLIIDIDMPFDKLAGILHRQFRRCFTAKK